MPSLKQISDLGASRLNRPYDEMLKAEIRALFPGEITLLLRRSIDANGLDKQYVASFTVDLIKVDSVDEIGIDTASNVLRSENKIPIPIRYKTPIPFIYVGDVKSNFPFGYVNEYEKDFVKDLPNIGNSITYTWKNQYLYIYNNTKLTKAKVIAAYSSFNLIKDNTTTSNGIFYTDDMELPYPQDLINAALLSLLQGILGNIDSKDKVKATHLDNE